MGVVEDEDGRFSDSSPGGRDAVDRRRADEGRAGAELAQGSRNSLARGACGATPQACVDPRETAWVALLPLGEQRRLPVARGRNERDERAVSDRTQPVGERGPLNVLPVIAGPA